MSFKRAGDVKLLGERVDTHTERLDNILQNRPPGMHLREKFICRHCPLLMIINDFHFAGISVLPTKADPPLIVDPISYDSWGSHESIQTLQLQGYEAELLSVDTTI